MKSDFMLQQNGILSYLTIAKFTETNLVCHGFSTRLGGKSQKPYHTLNLGLHVGDCLEGVWQNRKIYCQALGVNWEDMVAAEQVHGEAIHVVNNNDKGKGAADYATALAATDALITNIPRLPLSTYYADCVPIFFLDPDNAAIGLAHAGWKGTLARIGAKTLKRMEEVFGTRPERCLIGLGPSISSCCYEVDEVLKDRFAQKLWPVEKIFQPTKHKWKLDLPKANRLALLEAGATKENIFMSNYCTMCRKDLFFSYRGESGKTGRMAAVIMLK